MLLVVLLAVLVSFVGRATKYFSSWQLARETREWHQTADLIAAFLAPKWET